MYGKSWKIFETNFNVTFNFREETEIMFPFHRSMACAETIKVAFLWEGMNELYL